MPPSHPETRPKTLSKIILRNRKPSSKSWQILKAGQPLALGPVEAPIGALAGITLSLAGKHAESSTECLRGGDRGTDGTVEKVILGEAALSAVMTMKRVKLEQEGNLQGMAQTVKKLSPIVKQVAPHIMGAVMEPALRIALDTINTNGNPCGRWMLKSKRTREC